MAREVAIDARALSKRFGQVHAVESVDLAVRAGEVRGLLGRNGAGKTTLLRILLGLVRPDGGSVSLLGRPAAAGVVELDGLAGFVEEPRFYPYLTGKQNLELLARLDGGGARERVEESLALVDLTAHAGEKAGGYSSGMRQRLGLAASLLRAPQLLVLDEPTNGLDPEAARQLRLLLQRLAESGVTIVISSHDMEEVDEICECVTVLHAGRVVWDGTIERLRDESPPPSMRLSTSDEARALARAARTPGVLAGRAADGTLTVSAPAETLDAFVLALAADGVAIRGLEPAMSSTEAMFLALTSS